jgi:hypothetical protein
MGRSENKGLNLLVGAFYKNRNKAKNGRVLQPAQPEREEKNVDGEGRGRGSKSAWFDQG